MSCGPDAYGYAVMVLYKFGEVYMANILKYCPQWLA